MPALNICDVDSKLLMHHPESPLLIRKYQPGHALKKHPPFPAVFSQGDILAALLSAAPLVTSHA